jgi:hypothetical protein
MLRSLGVIVFIAIVGSAAAYFARRPTVARGDVLAADLVQSNPMLQKLECDDHVPIGMTGGRFKCQAHFKNGDSAQYTLAIARTGQITVVEQGENTHAPTVKKTSDPWGD